jgi:hypothetical protein
MAKQLSSSVLDALLNAVKNGATKVLLIKNYSAGDSYATVTGNAVASATISATDFTGPSAGASSARTLTFNGKSATATAAALAAGNGQDHHFAFTDGSSTVLWVTDETAELANNVGDTITIPSVVLTSNQPT